MRTLVFLASICLLLAPVVAAEGDLECATSGTDCQMACPPYFYNGEPNPDCYCWIPLVGETPVCD